MQLAQYLMCVATRHEQAKDEHEEEFRELRLKERQRTAGRRSVRRYWDNHRVIKTIQELPAAMFGIMEGLLIKQ